MRSWRKRAKPKWRSFWRAMAVCLGFLEGMNLIPLFLV